jgi:hypothetical protein
MDLTTPKGRSWLRMLRLANREARREHGLLDHPLAAKSVEAALVDGLLLAQPHNYDALLHGTHGPRLRLRGPPAPAGRESPVSRQGAARVVVGANRVSRDRV